jgi:hypothetical protein
MIAPPATADIIEVAQEITPGGGDFDVLGSIETVDTPLTAAGYYAYNNPLAASFNGLAPEPVDRLSYLFVLKTLPSDLALVIVHDAPNDGSGGNAAMQIDIVNDPDGADWLVQDDPGDAYTGTAGGNLFTTTQNWSPCCTDGFVLGNLNNGGDVDQDDGNGVFWTVYLQFTEAPNGIVAWRAYSSSEVIELSTRFNRRVRLQPAIATPVEPGTWGAIKATFR